jgi:PII-like signaling protein
LASSRSSPAGHAVYFATGCFIAYFFSGHSGIYLSQRIGIPKSYADDLPFDIPLRDARELNIAVPDANLDTQFASRAILVLKTKTTQSSMPSQHKIAVTDMGKLRIYLAPTEKIQAAGFWSRVNPKLVYQEIIEGAKKSGLINAVAYRAHHGFSNSGRIESSDPEVGNRHLTMCIEIVDLKEKLENFCHDHAGLLKDKVIVYKQVEHWTIRPHEVSEPAESLAINSSPEFLPKIQPLPAARA